MGGKGRERGLCVLRTKFHGKTYEFPDLRILMGKANEEKSGDRLAGVAAETAAERVAARFVLADMPLWVLREQPVVPYEQDESHGRFRTPCRSPSIRTSRTGQRGSSASGCSRIPPPAR